MYIPVPDPPLYCKMKPKSFPNRGKRRSSNSLTAVPQPTPQQLKLTMGFPPAPQAPACPSAQAQVLTFSTSVDDPFKRKLFVPD